MKSLIEELYNGHISPWEQIASKDPAYVPTHEQISETKALLNEKLGTKDAERLEYLDRLFCEVSGMHGSAAFSYGFKLGAMLVAEAVLTQPWV